jgi:hypothetical protein
MKGGNPWKINMSKEQMYYWIFLSMSTVDRTITIIRKESYCLRSDKDPIGCLYHLFLDLTNLLVFMLTRIKLTLLLRGHKLPPNTRRKSLLFEPEAEEHCLYCCHTEPTSFYSWAHVSITCSCTFDRGKSREKTSGCVLHADVRNVLFSHPPWGTCLLYKCKDNADLWEVMLGQFWVYNATAPHRRRTNAATSPAICNSSRPAGTAPPVSPWSTFWACLHWSTGHFNYSSKDPTDTPDSMCSTIRCLSQYQINPFSNLELFLTSSSAPTRWVHSSCSFLFIV